MLVRLISNKLNLKGHIYIYLKFKILMSPIGILLMIIQELSMTESKNIKNRIVRIKLTDGTQINGRINISGYNRLSDLIMDRSNDFLVITEAILYKTDMENTVKHETIFLGKRYIVWAAPESGQK